MARKKWLRGPTGEIYGFKYRLNERCPLLIDEVVWDKDTINAIPYDARPNRFKLSVNQAVWATPDGHCFYCGEVLKPWETFSIDHVIPKSKGGTNEFENLVPCCLHCNKIKKDRPARVMHEQ